MKEFELIDSGKTIANSRPRNLKIYKTKYKNVFLSEMDVSTKENLKEKNMLQLIYNVNNKRGQLMISKELFMDESNVYEIIDKEINFDAK